MKNLVLTPWIILVVNGLLAASAAAEPHLAQRYGLQCSSCHSNVTGGGKRTDAGNAYAMGLTDSPIATGFSNKIGDTISVGANFRSDWTYVSFDDPEAVGGLPAQTAPEDQSAFNINAGALYMQFDLSENISFYLDRQMAPNSGRTREAMVIFRNLFAEDTYFKVGRFFMPYGLRLQDDSAFIRQQTGFNFDNSDIGFEAGYEPGSWSFTLSATNGTQGAGENNKDKQVVFTGTFVQPSYRIGVSGATNNAPAGSQDTYGVFGGLTLGDFVFLGELDWIDLMDAQGSRTQIATYLSVDYLLSPSVNLRLSHEYLDPDYNIDENERTRISLLGEKFLNQFTQFRAGARIYDDIPQSRSGNRQEFFSELHLFF